MLCPCKKFACLIVEKMKLNIILTDGIFNILYIRYIARLIVETIETDNYYERCFFSFHPNGLPPCSKLMNRSTIWNLLFLPWQLVSYYRLEYCLWTVKHPRTWMDLLKTKLPFRGSHFMTILKLIRRKRWRFTLQPILLHTGLKTPLSWRPI